MTDTQPLATFIARLTASRRPALLLDFDGTLAPFVTRRDRAVAYPGVNERLAAIRDRTRLVIVSGRAIEELAPLLELEPLPELWGCHGGQRRLPDGTRHDLVLPAETARFLETVERWGDGHIAAASGERKPLSLAYHMRGLASHERARLRALISTTWAHKLPRDMELHEFDGGLEFRVSGITKALAVRAIVAETDADSAVAYLGDDHTDEDAFRALGTRGLSVLVRSEWRDSAAQLWLKPPEELLTFLDRWIVATTG